MVAKALNQRLAGILDDVERCVEDLQRQGVRELYSSAARPVSAADPPGQSADLTAIADRIAACRQCALHKTRTRTVPGQGHAHPGLMFVGEAPGEDEDRQGLAFVGRAGQLLTRIIEAMGLSRDEVFIGNILKCRPPGNRRPTPDEMRVCLPFLMSQIELLQPAIIVTLGATAYAGLMQPDPEFKISDVRGRWQEFNGIPLMPTFHPSYLLRNNAAKADVWLDMQAVLQKMGRSPPPRSANK